MAVKEAAPRYRRFNHPSLDEHRGAARIMAADLAGTFGMSPDEDIPALHDQFHAYRATLHDDRRCLLERFEIVDIARKVVGAGSVGTRAFIVLLAGRDAHDPLFLQVKEATASVLEGYEQDYEEFGKAVRSGRLEGVEGV